MSRLPDGFLAMMSAWLDKADLTFLEQALELEPSVSIRLNPQKPFAQAGALECVPWSTLGRYLPQRPPFTFDPLLHGGCYYVQEASSMFLEQVMRTYVTRPVRMLDACAAPGGKSTHALSLLPKGSLLISNEYVRQRASALKENLTKWGREDTVITSTDVEAFQKLGPCFDVILTDVPCSGEGMFRKEEDAVSGWGPDNVSLCQKRQREILSKLWPSLKTGGLLIYSTCTFNAYEDEMNVAWIKDELGAEILDIPIRDEWNIQGTYEGFDFPACHFLPSRTRGEGFFMAVLRKTTEDSDTSFRPSQKPSKPSKGKSREQIPSDAIRQCRSWISTPDYELLPMETGVTAFPKAHLTVLEQIRLAGIDVLSSGVTLATIKGRDLVPDASLATSLILQRNAFQTLDVDLSTAISYLRRESIPTPDGLPKGYVLITYRGAAIGWAKNVGSRANNLYPQEWRIKSTHLPEINGSFF